jgi:hypothetical protein
MTPGKAFFHKLFSRWRFEFWIATHTHSTPEVTLAAASPRDVYVAPSLQNQEWQRSRR